MSPLPEDRQQEYAELAAEFDPAFERLKQSVEQRRCECTLVGTVRGVWERMERIVGFQARFGVAMMSAGANGELPHREKYDEVEVESVLRRAEALVPKEQPDYVAYSGELVDAGFFLGDK